VNRGVFILLGVVVAFFMFYMLLDRIFEYREKVMEYQIHMMQYEWGEVDEPPDDDLYNKQ
jgi:hypothetical protein